ncbi:hypothetical protein HHX47_DHR1000600 [Lentinula edodes]|nr:hypothetical protein HHX47_DHR1000600 [Lentinula edodes]
MDFVSMLPSDGYGNVFSLQAVDDFFGLKEEPKPLPRKAKPASIILDVGNDVFADSGEAVSFLNGTNTGLGFESCTDRKFCLEARWGIGNMTCGGGEMFASDMVSLGLWGLLYDAKQALLVNGWTAKGLNESSTGGRDMLSEYY